MTESPLLNGRLILLGLLALALPLITLAGLTAKAVHDRTTGENWQIEIGGYDPRHLLQGHYITFRYNWNWINDQQACPQDSSACCLCLKRDLTEHIDPAASLHNCQSPRLAACDGVIRGEPRGAGFTFGKERYYVPERHASYLDNLLRRASDSYRFHVELSVSDRHKAAIRNLYINGTPLEDFIRQK